MSDDLHEKVFLRYPLRHGVERRVMTSRFKDKWRVNIREWYLGEDGWTPGNKGYSIAASDYGVALRALNGTAAALLAAGVPIYRDGDEDAADHEPCAKKAADAL